MSVQSTTQRGNAFRDLVDELLSAAGFRTDPERLVSYKKVDNKAVWLRDEFEGAVAYLVEVKDYERDVPLDECTQFVSDYGELVRRGEADQAWLVSRGGISAHGKEAIEKAGLKCFTFIDFQRRLLLLDRYLRDLIAERDDENLNAFYVSPVTSDGIDLEEQVNCWVKEEGSAPLFVFGAYGEGKSTFATQYAARLATSALSDPTQRAPILVRLGEIFDEQSLDGLLGKVLASRYRVSGYHFKTFESLNALGRFVVIYDGFDEMKHGMTFTRFQQVMAELMRLDKGSAKILVLGRETAFHDEGEFRAIINGRTITASGRDVPDPNRRPYLTAKLRGFSLEDARHYVRSYFPIRAAEAAKQRGAAVDTNWVQTRIDELLAGELDPLLNKPVHAQMLCQIAVDPSAKLNNLTVYDLFDTFVHYLLLRETQKKGRDPSFTIDVRRSFNAALAWWLWERSAASATTLSDIPDDLCKSAAKNAEHDLDNEGLRRELIQGCLIEKAAQTIFFGHRSLQEFLAADHLIETNLLEGSIDKKLTLDRVLRYVTPEVTTFVVAGVQTNLERRDAALKWFSHLENYQGQNVSFTGFNLFTRLAHELLLRIDRPLSSPWLLWLDFFQRTGAKDFTSRHQNTFPFLADYLKTAQNGDETAQAAATYALGRTLRHGVGQDRSLAALAIAAMLRIPTLKQAVSTVRNQRNKRYPVQRADSYLVWTFLRATSVVVDPNVTLVIDCGKLVEDAQRTLRRGFVEDEATTIAPTVRISAALIYQALDKLGTSNSDIDAIRPFFNEPATRAAISPLEVQVLERKPVVSAARPDG